MCSSHLQSNPPTSQHRALPWLLALALLATRLPGLPRLPDDHDGVNLVLGLQHFDLAAHRPHFPGYPVLLALAWPWTQLGITGAAAIALTSAWVGALAVALLAKLLLERAGAAVALVVGLAYILLPGLWLADATALSDGLGTHAVTLCLVAALRSVEQPRWAFAAAAGCGLLLGIRASAWPIALGLGAGLVVLATTWLARLRLVAVAGVAVLVWLVPLTVLAGGLRALVDLGMRFTHGHLHDWGNTAVGVGGGLRLGQWGHGVVEGALGLTGLALVMVVTLRPGRCTQLRTTMALLGLAIAYAMWLIVGQNPDKSRHVLPLLPVLLLAVGLLASRGDGGGVLLTPNRAWRVAMALLLVAMAAQSGQRWVAKISQPSPEAQLGQWLAAGEPGQLVVLGGAEVGVVRHLAPAVRSLRIAEPADVEAAAAPGGHRPARVWVTSRVPGVAHLALGSRVAAFAPRPGVDERGLEVWALLPAGGPQVAEVER